MEDLRNEKYIKPETRLENKTYREKKMRDIEYNYAKNSYDGSGTPRRLSQ
jgi:hypothetical protein